MTRTTSLNPGHSKLRQTNWTNTRIKVISFKGLGSGFQIRQADPITGSIPFISDLSPAFPLRFLSGNFKQCACPRPIRPEHHHHQFIHQPQHLDQCQHQHRHQSIPTSASSLSMLGVELPGSHYASLNLIMQGNVCC